MTTPAPLPRLVELDTFRKWPGVVVEAGQDDSATFVLDSASALIRLESGNVARWPDADAIPAAIVTLAVQVAARTWRNPDCAAMVTTGPFSEQFAQGVEDALYLTDANRDVIAKSIGTGVAGLWSQSLTRDDDPGLPYVFDCFTGEQVPRSPYPPADWLYGSVGP